MTKEQKRALREKKEKLKERAKEIREACAAEKRVRNEAEDAEFKDIEREVQDIDTQLFIAADERSQEEMKENEMEKANAIIRENLKGGKRTEMVLTRSMTGAAVAAAGGIVPLRVQDIVEPLSEGLILNKVGLPFMTGLSGDYVWPVYEAIEAQVVKEGVKLSDSTISMSKLTASPERIGVTVPVSREALVQSSNIIEHIVRQEIPMAVSRLLNKIVVGLDKVANATNLKGPFVDMKAGATSFEAAEPTFKELLAMKAKILGKGILGENMCFIMTQAMKAVLEGTPKDAGSGIMICENDKIAGIPVFCSNYIGEGYIGLGDWRYQPMGLFGEMTFIVDPYTDSKSDIVNFTLNTMYGTTTLRPEAFVLRKGQGVGM